MIVFSYVLLLLSWLSLSLRSRLLALSCTCFWCCWESRVIEEIWIYIIEISFTRWFSRALPCTHLYCSNRIASCDDTPATIISLVRSLTVKGSDQAKVHQRTYRTRLTSDGLYCTEQLNGTGSLSTRKPSEGRDWILSIDADPIWEGKEEKSGDRGTEGNFMSLT